MVKAHHRREKGGQRRAIWRNQGLGKAIESDRDSAYAFAIRSIEESSRAGKIEIDVHEQRVDPVKLAFEQNGYSVHSRPGFPKHLVAYRVVPDRAPRG